MAAASLKITGCSFYSTKRGQETIKKKIEELVKRGNVKEVLVGQKEITVAYEGCRPPEDDWKVKLPQYAIKLIEAEKETDNTNPHEGEREMTVGAFFIVVNIEGKCYCITAAHGISGVGKTIEFVTQRGLRFSGTVKWLVYKDQDGAKLDLAVVEAGDILASLVNASIGQNGIDNVKMKVYDEPLLDLLGKLVKRENNKTLGIIEYIGFRIVNGELSSKNFMVIQPLFEKQFAIGGDSGSAVYLHSAPSTRTFVGMVSAKYEGTEMVVIQTASLVLETLREHFQAEVTMINSRYIQQDQQACRKVVKYPADRKEDKVTFLQMPAVALSSNPVQAINDDIRTTLLLDKCRMTLGDVKSTAEIIIEKIEQSGSKEEVRLFHDQVSAVEKNLKKVKKAIKTIQPSDKSTLFENFSNALNFTINVEMLRDGDNQWSRLIVLSEVPNDDKWMEQVAENVKYMAQNAITINAQIHFLLFGDEPNEPTGTPSQQITSQRADALEHCREISALTGGSTILLRHDEEGTCQDKVDSWFERTWGISSSAQKHPSLKAGHTQSSSDPKVEILYPMTLKRPHVRK